ncbi:hypothetical protein PINS_up001110 [Pythium insidiosum]|nr:hypothetical protein PINS_up001110 [Pythium insidiosum]
MHSLSVVSRLCAQRLKKHRESTQETSEALESLRFFLRGQLETFLRATLERPQVHEDASSHQAAFLSDCLRSLALTDVAQIVRQQWTGDHLQGEFSEARDRLASIVSSCVGIESELQRHVLASAHDLAADALAQSDARLLRATLELVACVAPTTVYAVWCRHHLGATVTVTSDDDRCLRSRTGASGETAHCSLVQSKRQLQFLVAFLLELDRPPTEEDKSQQRNCHHYHPRADHVLAHLSAVKTHQTAPTGAAVGELLADFCSTTRLRHVQLQSREQHEEAATPTNSNSDMAVSRRLSLESSSSSSVSASNASNGSTSAAIAGTKASVRELVAAFREQSAKLPPQVTQWRMFQPQAWRQRLLPCCLDVERWTSECRDDPNFIVPWVGLVTQLAQHNLVPATEFSAFLERIERWTEAEQRRMQKTRQRQRQRRQIWRPSSTMNCDDSVEWLRQLVERFVALQGQENDDALASYRKTRWECVTDAFVVAFEDIVEQQDETQRDCAISAVQSIIIDQFITRSASSTEAFLHHHVLLWVRLLSSEGDTSSSSSATSATSSDPLARMTVMDAYCGLLTARLASARSTNSSPSRVDVASASALGCLLGLLSSLSFCEKMAARWTREAEREALGTVAVAVLEPAQLHTAIMSRVTLTSAFVAAFLRGLLTQSPVQTGSSGVLERVWTTELREFLVWLAHHVEWTASLTPSVAVDDAVYGVIRELLPARWFQSLTSAAENVRSVLQWKRFWDLELHVAFAGAHDLSLVRRTRDQMETLVLSRRATEVSVKDVLVWIAQASMTTALTAKHGAHAPTRGALSRPVDTPVDAVAVSRRC